jgi:hypothetical protein
MPNGKLKILAFVAATLLATGILVVAGLEDANPGARVGWFGSSPR